MTHSIPRIVAAVILATAGALVATTAFGLVVARALISLRPDILVRPGDVALVNDLVPLTPFIVVFAVANVAAAIALLVGRASADRLATAIATVATSLGAFAFVLVALGHDPLSARTAVGDPIDGLAIIGSFTAVYVAVVVALAFAGEPDHERANAHPHSLPAAA